MRTIGYLTAIVLLAAANAQLVGQSPDPKTQIQEMLNAQFAHTKVTDDQLDIVTPGSVLVLQKDGLLMCGVSNGNGVSNRPATSTYKDGEISRGFVRSSAPAVQNGRRYVQPRADCGTAPQRMFVAGEKFWLTKAYVDLGGDRVVLRLYSDPYNSIRYWGELQIPFSNESVPSADQLMKTIAEVVTVEHSDNSPAADAQYKNTAPMPSTEPGKALTPMAPPPPPKTIALGQTKEQVVAMFGQPQKIVSLGSKEMYYYPDMKVTFVGGKVTDVQ